MQLTPDQLRQFSTILQDAFDLFTFDQMLLFRLGIKRPNIALGANVAQIIFEVFGYFQSRHKTTDLVMAAREANPDHPGLVSFAQQFRLAPLTLVRHGDTFAPTANERELEREIRNTNSNLDPVKWRMRLGQVESQVCRIEIDNGETVTYGTGFLVGPDAVMTNWHVVKRIVAKTTNPEEVLLRFDYKKSEDGTTINSGTIYRLNTEEWYVDVSEASPVDKLVDPMGQLPSEEQLDYAILNVDGSPGTDRVGGAQAAPNAPERKWIKISDTAHNYVANSPLYIMQHPQGEPLKLAMDTDAIIGVNENGTRLRYRTNTETGSSGSPCFNQHWDFIALHHSGDPNFSEFHKPQYNEGIPAAAIFNLLRKRGKDFVLGG